MGLPIRYAFKQAIESSKKREFRDTTDMLIDDIIRKAPKTFGTNLRGYQRDNYLTDKELASILRTREGDIRYLKEGKYEINLANILQFSLRLGIALDDLLTKDIYGISKEKWYDG